MQIKPVSSFPVADLAPPPPAAGALADARSGVEAALAHERQRMAAEVHDSLGQQLAFVKLRLPLLEDALRAGDQPRALGYCGELRLAATEAHANLRALLTHLRAPMPAGGLGEALASACVAFRAQSPDVVLSFECAGSVDGVLAPDLQADVFHIAREALENIARHARARHASVRLAVDAAGLGLTVEDDGCGLPADATLRSTDDALRFAAHYAAQHASHYGLVGMSERARRAGGSLEIGARAGGGTRIQLRVPCAAVEQRT